MTSSLSIAFPCWNRGQLLEITLETIRRQNYPGPLELVVVESGEDGLTEYVAKHFGARYIRQERPETFPVFQSITEMWNRCAKESSHEILLLQTAEVLHESGNVIQELVKRVESKPKVVATPLIKDLLPDGSFTNWYNHPTEGSRPGWVSGAGPHAMRREDFFSVGGYDLRHYGYGGEDNFWMYVLRKNGFSIEYVENAVCGHQWHERTKYEPVTGYSNRSLTNILIMEIEDGKRKPICNGEPLELDLTATEEAITDAVIETLSLNPGTFFKDWAKSCWLVGNKHPDLTFVAQRSTANEGLGLISQIGEMVTEAAWAIIRAKEARAVAAAVTGQWAARASLCADIDATWAARSLAKGKELMKQCTPIR
jgi:hypothetical protein